MKSISLNIILKEFIDIFNTLEFKAESSSERFNKDCTKYDKSEYQWHVDWFFYQNNEEDCKNILKQLPVEIANIERDASGIIIFFTLVNRK